MDKINSFLDLANTLLCVYIIGVVIVRLTMMSWKTHRRPWIVIYFVAGISAAAYLYFMLDNLPHWRWPAFFGYTHMALWFHESRSRWMHKAPDYMSINCAHLPPDAPLPENCPIVDIRKDGC